MTCILMDLCFLLLHIGTFYGRLSVYRRHCTTLKKKYHTITYPQWHSAYHYITYIFWIFFKVVEHPDQRLGFKVTYYLCIQSRIKWVEIQSDEAFYYGVQNYFSRKPHCEKLCMKIDTLGRCIKGYIIYLCISMRKMYRIQLNANFDIPNFKVGLLQSINKYVLKILCCRLKLIKILALSNEIDNFKHQINWH